MRYYVLARSNHPGIRPYVLGEVVREASDNGTNRETSLASAFAGVGSTILTRDELLADPEGPRALACWESGDEAEFDRETLRILANIGQEERRVSRSHLTLLPDPEVELLPSRD